MENMTVTRDPKTGEIVIRCDPTQNLGPSSSGKTDLIASSGGMVPVPGCPGLLLNLNLCKKR